MAEVEVEERRGFGKRNVPKATDGGRGRAFPMRSSPSEDGENGEGFWLEQGSGGGSEEEVEE